MYIFQVQLPAVGNDGTYRGQAVQAIFETIATIAGGATRTDGYGLWKDRTGKLVADKIVQVQSYATWAQRDTLIALVNFWTTDLDQDALVWASWVADVGFVQNRGK